MSQGIVNPVVGLEVSRLRSLPFEVIGNSEVILIRLPTDPSTSHLQHSRRLLLRIGWVFEGLAQIHADATNVPTEAVIDGSTIFRLLLLVLKTCRGEEVRPTTSPSLDYRIWREIALDTIIWGIRLLMFSSYEISIDEEDLVMSELQLVKNSWARSEELQIFETFAFEELFPSSVSASFSHHVGQDSWQDEMEKIVEIMADTSSADSFAERFWKLHDILSEASVVRQPSQDRRSGKQPVDMSGSVLRLIRTIYEKSHIESNNTIVSVIVRRQFRRLFRVYGISEEEEVAQISGHRYMLQDPQVFKRISRILDSEIKEFRRSLLSNWENEPISRWLARANSLSPLSVTSEERHSLSPLGSAGSLFGSKTSIKSARKSVDNDAVPVLERPRNIGPDDRLSVISKTDKTRSGSTEDRWNETGFGEASASLAITSPMFSAPTQASHPGFMQPRDPETDKSSLQEEAIWQARHDLPVSIFIPRPNPDRIQETTSSVDVSVPPHELYGAFPPSSSSAEVVFPVSGLEIIQPSPTLPPKVPVEPRETRIPLREGSIRSTCSSHSRQTLPGNDDESRRNTASELDTTLRPTLTSSSASITSEKKSRFSSFLRSSKKTGQSMGPLPPIKYCFSDCATYIMVWCKTDPEYIVRITEPFRSGRRIPLHVAEANSQPNARKSIRHLACTNDLVAAVVHIEIERWIFTMRNPALQPLFKLQEDVPKVFAVAVSPNRRYIALGCGLLILLCRFTEKGSQSYYRIETKSVHAAEASKMKIIRAHQLNFTPDSSRIVSAVQVQGPHEHQVHTEIWTCVDSLELESSLGPVTVVAGYAGDTGISSVHSVESSDSADAQKILLTAAVSKPYHSLLSTAPGWRNRYLNVPDTCIINCAQSWMLGTSHYFAVRSGPDKIVRVDGRSGNSEPVSNIAADCRGLNLRHHECVALGMPGPETIYALWRTADQGLMLKTFFLDRGRWVPAALELGSLYRQLAGFI